MNFLQQTLARIESRLQTLIEGSTAHLFPAYDLHRELANRLSIAMQVELRPQPSGGWLAPNEYTIYVPAEHFSGLPIEELTEVLSQELEQCAAEGEIQFNTSPNIRMLPNPETGSTAIQIIAQFSLGPNGETANLQAAALPPERPSYNAFLFVEGSTLFLLERLVINIGRQEDNDLVLDDPRISRHHAQLRWVKDHYRLFDLGSTGGTLVNDSPISQWTLMPGDTISLAGLCLIFGTEQADDGSSTQKIPREGV